MLWSNSRVIAVARLKGQGMGASKIAKQLGIGRASVYRVLTRRDAGSEHSKSGIVAGASSVLQTSL
jgi:transposase